MNVCTFFMHTGIEEERGIMLVGWLASERFPCTCFLHKIERVDEPHDKSKRGERERERKEMCGGGTAVRDAPFVIGDNLICQFWGQ